MTSPNAFFISSKCWFSGLLGWKELKRQKMAQKDRKLSLTLYLRNCTTYVCGFWYTCVKWYLQQIFSFFLKSDFSGFQNSSLNTKRKFWGVRHLPHICVIFLLSYDLFCPNCSYQGHNFQKFTPNILMENCDHTICPVLSILFSMAQPIRLGFFKSLSLS